MMNRGQMAAQIANARASRGGMNQIQPPPRMAAPVASPMVKPAVMPATLAASQPMPVSGMAKGGKVKKMAKGGSVTRGDGMCMKGHTKGKMY
jgi:hypothetical protein